MSYLINQITQELLNERVTASKIGVGPGYYFDGVNDLISGDGSTLGGNVFTILSDFQLGKFAEQALFAVRNGSSQRLLIRTDSTGKAITVFSDGQSPGVFSTGDIGLQVGGRYVLVVVSDGGSITVYINGKKVSSSSWSTSVLTPNAYEIGIRESSLNPFNGSVYRTNYFNRALTASEVKQISNGQYLGFADYGATGSASGSLDSVTGVATGLASFTYENATAAHNQSVGGETGATQLTTVSTSTITRFYAIEGTKGKRVKIKLRYYIPSTNATLDGIQLINTSMTGVIHQASSPDLDTWNTIDVDHIIGGNGGTDTLQVVFLGGGSSTGATSGDIIYIKGFSLTPLGLVLDLNEWGVSPTQWFDHSGNSYNGAVNGATRINPISLAADKHVSLTNLPTSASGLAAGRVWNDAGTLKIVT